MRNTIFAIGLMAASVATAQASSVVTWDFATGTNTPLSTGQNDTFAVRYNSQSVVLDTDGSGTLSHGDTIRSYGGFGPLGFNALNSSPLSNGVGVLDHGRIGANFVTGFSPDGSPSPEFYNSSNGYVFTFFFDDLIGTYDQSVNNFVYTAGTIQFGLYSFNAATGLPVGFNPMFDFEVNSGKPSDGATEVQQNFFGQINPLSLQNGTGDAMMFDGVSLTDWFAKEATVNFAISQTVQAGLSGLPSLPSEITFDNGSALVAAIHDGSVTFSVSVPQPASISILALGLLGLRLAARNRKAKK